MESTASKKLRHSKLIFFCALEVTRQDGEQSSESSHTAPSGKAGSSWTYLRLSGPMFQHRMFSSTSHIGARKSLFACQYLKPSSSTRALARPHKMFTYRMSLCLGSKVSGVIQNQALQILSMGWVSSDASAGRVKPEATSISDNTSAGNSKMVFALPCHLADCTWPASSWAEPTRKSEFIAPWRISLASGAIQAGVEFKEVVMKWRSLCADVFSNFSNAFVRTCSFLRSWFCSFCCCLAAFASSRSLAFNWVFVTFFGAMCASDSREKEREQKSKRKLTSSEPLWQSEKSKITTSWTTSLSQYKTCVAGSLCRETTNRHSRLYSNCARQQPETMAPPPCKSSASCCFVKPEQSAGGLVSGSFACSWELGPHKPITVSNSNHEHFAEP